MKRIKNSFIALFFLLALGFVTAFAGFESTGQNSGVIRSYASAGFMASYTSIAADEYSSRRFNLGSIARVEESNWQSLFPDEESDFVIDSTLGLYNFAQFVNYGANFVGKTVYLLNDIDYSLKTGIDNMHVSIGTVAKPFKGTFDGSGYNVVLGETILSTAGSPRGFFGQTDSAIIKNLCISGSITSASVGYFGGIAGYAVDTIIINCTNMVDIRNNSASGYAGGIIAGGERFEVLNCLNFGNVNSANVGSVAATSGGDVWTCVNFGELVGTVFNGYSSFIDDWDYDDWIDDTVTDTQKKQLIKELNEDVRTIKYNNKCDAVYARESGLDIPLRHYRDMLYWGIDDNGFPLVGALNPVLDSDLMYEYSQKMACIAMSLHWLDDCYLYIVSDSDAAEGIKDMLYLRFLELMDELDDLYIDDSLSEYVFNEDFIYVPNTDNAVLGFSRLMAEFYSYFCDETNQVYDLWAVLEDTIIEKGLYDFARGMILTWFEDCYAYVTGTDEKANSARALLYQRFRQLVIDDDSELVGIVYVGGDSTKFATDITVFINYAFVELDNIFYDWSIGGMLDEFEDAYNDNKADLAGAALRKIKNVYLETKDAIMEAENGFAEDESMTWIEFASEIEGIVYTAIAKFDKINSDAQKQRVTTTWIIALSISISLLVAVIVTLVFIFRNKMYKYKTIIFNQGDGNGKFSKKQQELNKRAEAISERARLEREMIEAQVDAQRTKTQMTLRLKKEKEEMRAMLAAKDAEMKNKEAELQKKREEQHVKNMQEYEDDRGD